MYTCSQKKQYMKKAYKKSIPIGLLHHYYTQILIYAIHVWSKYLIY